MARALVALLVLVMAGFLAMTVIDNRNYAAENRVLDSLATVGAERSESLAVVLAAANDSLAAQRALTKVAVSDAARIRRRLQLDSVRNTVTIAGETPEEPTVEYHLPPLVVKTILTQDRAITALTADNTALERSLQLTQALLASRTAELGIARRQTDTARREGSRHYWRGLRDGAIITIVLGGILRIVSHPP